MLEYLFRICEDVMWREYGCIDFNMREYCWANGHWHYDEIADGDGNIVDYSPVINAYDIQEACNELHLNIDVINLY